MTKPRVCVTDYPPYSEREIWVRKQVMELGVIEYSAEEIAAEKAAKAEAAAKLRSKK